MRISYRVPGLILVSAALAAVPAGMARENPAAVEGTDPTAAAEALLDRGEAAQAAALFARVLQTDSTQAAAMAGRVRALIRQDLWQQALEEARGFHARGPGAAVAGALGEALFRAGRLAEARSVLEPWATGEAAGGRALVTYARVLAAAGRPEAESYARRAVEAAPDDRQVLLWASEIAGDRARTIALLRRYVERAEGDDPDRITAATETLAFLEQSGERRFWVSDKRPERLELPLRPVPGTGGPAGYTIEMTGGEDKKVRLLLDTGSTGLFMVERSARKLGVEALHEQTAFGGGGDERHATRRGVLPVVGFGALRFRDALISTSDRPIHPSGAYHGVISLSAFDGYTVTIDMAARRLTLGPPVDLPDGVPYWTVAGQWLVDAASGDSPGLFLLDTGAQTSVLDAAFAAGIEGARLGGPAAVQGYGGPMSGARWVDGARIRFQGRQTPMRKLRVVELGLRSRLGGVELAGFAGLDLLDGARLVLDTARHVVVLDAPAER